MDAAHPHERARRHHRERVSDVHPACPRGPCRDRPAARQRKDAIDCQPKQTLFRALRPARRRRMQMRAQRGDARVIGHRRGERKNRRMGECRGSEHRRDLRLHLADARILHPIDLGQRDRAAPDAESSRMARCSRVCGMTPSSAAITNSA